MHVIIFNPPYVPTDESEVCANSPIALSWAGGIRGRLVMGRIFPNIPKMMFLQGKFYLLIIKFIANY